MTCLGPTVGTEHGLGIQVIAQKIMAATVLVVLWIESREARWRAPLPSGRSISVDRARHAVRAAHDDFRNREALQAFPFRYSQRHYRPNVITLVTICWTSIDGALPSPSDAV